MRKILVLCALLLTITAVYAQDPNFSQYYASPLSLNPANTGFFDGDFRLAINERQQWFNVGASYNTTSISADFKITPNQAKEYDVLGIGVMGLFDSSLGGALQSNYLSASAAYHKSMAYDGTQMFTMGVQYTYANIYLDYNKLTFASQFNGFNFDTSIPVYASSTNSFTNYSDINAGVLYAAHLPTVNIYSGLSLYHIAEPKQSLFNSDGTRLPRRFTVHAGGDVNISPASSILFSMLYMKQASARDEMIGAAYALKKADDGLNFYVGMWLRLNDAYIPYIGADYQNFSVGLNYSTTYNTGLNYNPATYEISLIYRNKKGATPRCPRF